jgi:hypothetical protein
VAIDLVGAGIPLALSLVFVLVLFLRSGRRINVHRIATYFMMTVILGAAVAAEYLVWDHFNGGLSAPTQLVLFTVIIPVGIALFLLLDRMIPRKLSLLQTYVVGTVGMALSDLFRTFSGLVNASPQIIGANGLEDGVFLDGLLLVLGYVFGAALYVSIKRYLRDRKGGRTLPPKGDKGWPAAGTQQASNSVGAGDERGSFRSECYHRPCWDVLRPSWTASRQQIPHRFWEGDSWFSKHLVFNVLVESIVNASESVEVHGAFSIEYRPIFFAC